MILLVLTLFLLANSLALGLLHLVWKKFAYHWLIAAGVALIVWVLALLSRFSLPEAITLSGWQLEEIYPEMPGFVLDEISWPLIVALATLHLGVVLTGSREAVSAGWWRWAGISAYTAIGVLAVSAENPLTLIMAWAGLDFLELLIYLSYLSSEQRRQQALRIIAIRLAGIFFVIASVSFAESGVTRTGLDWSGAGAIHLLLLATYLRLGLYPLAPPLFEERSLRVSLGTVLRLVSAAAALILIIRFGTTWLAAGESVGLQAFWLIFSALLGCYGALAWFTSEDELDGRPGWILGLASFSIAAAIGGTSKAGLAWVLAMIFSGGLLFLADVRDRMIRWIVLPGGVGLIMLPFSPSWAGIMPTTLPYLPSIFLFILASAAYISAFLMKGYSIRNYRPAGENWIRVFYLTGLILILLTYLGLGIFLDTPLTDISLLDWVGGFTTLLLAFAGIYWWRKGGAVPGWLINLFDAVFSFRWLSGFLNVFYSILDAIFLFFSRLIEGEGGVLWAILWLVIVLTFLIAGG